jgi:glycine cleavage system H protein
MSEIPQDRRYARSHEWARQLADGSVEVGISDHAQHALGDLVYVELPEVGRVLAAGEACAVVESVKAASDVYCPVAGQVIAVNQQLGAAPELVNQQPYGQGWLLQLKPQAPLANADLLDAADYAAVAAAG